MVNEKAERTSAEVRARRAFGVVNRRRRVPAQNLPRGLERDYTRAILALVDLLKESLEPLLQALPELSAQAERERADVGEGQVARSLIEKARERLKGSFDQRALTQVAERIGQMTAQTNRRELGKQIDAALGVDIVTIDPNLGALIDGFATENVSLIGDISTETFAKVEKATTRALASGTPHRELAKELENTFGFARKRAKLIARDQVGKLYSQVNTSRQKALGVEEFIWRTVGDGRVRDEHQSLNGRKFSYASPPSEGLPGQPILCRCFAEPVFDAILEGV